MKNSLLLLFALIIILNASAQHINTPDSIYHIKDSVFIPTRDGASISAIIVRKKGNTQPLPAILFFTTYHQGAGDAIFAKQSADRNYVGIVAYCRGIRADLNAYTPFEHDGTDVYDVIDWISKQPWSNGNVGMYGGSYTGFVQWAAVKNIHPALKTIVPQVAVMPGFDFPMENNVTLGFALNWSNDILKRKRLPQDLNDIWWSKGTSYRSLDSLAGQPNKIFQRWLQHPDYDNYWKSFVPSPQEYANINIPILTTTGYYDGSQIGALQYLRLHYKYNKNANHYLVIGPYDHWGGQRKAQANLMGYDIDPAANISMQDLAYQWLDHILKGEKKPELLQDKINYQVMGANVWRHAPTLDKMNNDTLTFFLSDTKKQNTYTLSNKKPGKKTLLHQTVDFKDRVNQHNYFTPVIVNDEVNASNGLVFETEAFDQALIINGAFSGDLKVSINKKDMDVSIALYERMADGKYFYLTRYLGRASYAKHNGKRQLLRPDQKENIPFDVTRMISKQINKGSRLVIVVNINKHPYEPINYGTGRDVGYETIHDAGEPLRIKWYSNSFIKIPVSKY